MNRNRKRGYLPAIFILFITLAFSSCINENTDDCGDVNIRIDYSHNMLSANALEGQAEDAVLYVFDSNGTLVLKDVSGNRPITNDYAVRTSDLKAGKYKFVAWAKSSHLKHDEADFHIPDLTVGASVLTDLTYYLKRTTGIQNKRLNNLLIGITEKELNNTNDTQHITVPLKKVNKHIRVLLLPYNGSSELDINNYTVSVVNKIGNGHVNHDYSILEDEPLIYHPHYKANIMPDPSETLNKNEIQKAAVVEINTSRLIDHESKEDNDRLRITTKDTEKEVVSINLPWFFSLTGMENHKNWDLQEYLDRQDQYVITLFIDDNPGILPEDRWIKTTIIINGWVLNSIPVNM